MKRNILAVFIATVFVLGLASLGARAAAGDAGKASGQTSAMTGQKDAQMVISKWPAKTKTAAQALIQKYGRPDKVKDDMLSWNNKGEWRRVAVYRESFKNAIGLAHENFIENTVSYNVPSAKTAELKKFDHALIIDRPKGTLASSGDSERANILALNLAHEVVSGRRSPESAKSFMQKTETEALAGKSSPYMDKLMFTPGAGAPPPGH